MFGGYGLNEVDRDDEDEEGEESDGAQRTGSVALDIGYLNDFWAFDVASESWIDAEIVELITAKQKDDDADSPCVQEPKPDQHRRHPYRMQLRYEEGGDGDRHKCRPCEEGGKRLRIREGAEGSRHPDPDPEPNKHVDRVVGEKVDAAIRGQEAEGEGKGEPN